MDISLILDQLLPAAKYGGVPGSTEESYNTLRWNDERSKPTWLEIEEAWPATQVLLEETNEVE